MKKIVTIFCCATLLSSCYKDVDLSQYQEETKLVLNCIANSDTTLMAKIATTWPYTASQRADDITGLAVEMLVNGESRGLMTYDNGMYRSDVCPQPGDLIEVRTMVDGVELSASDRMPVRPEVKRIEISHQRVVTDGSIMTDPTGIISQGNYNEEFTFHITIKNDPHERRYYFIRFKETNFRQAMGSIDYSYDPVFQATMEQINQNLDNLDIISHWGLPFSNEGMTGDEYTLTVKETGAPFNYNELSLGGSDRDIVIYAISEAYYKYILTMKANDGDATWQGKMTELGLAEPTKVFSNITGGTGIFGCIVPISMQVTLDTTEKTQFGHMVTRVTM